MKNVVKLSVLGFLMCMFVSGCNKETPPPLEYMVGTWYEEFNRSVVKILPNAGAKESYVLYYYENDKLIWAADFYRSERAKTNDGTISHFVIRICEDYPEGGMAMLVFTYDHAYLYDREYYKR